MNKNKTLIIPLCYQKHHHVTRWNEIYHNEQQQHPVVDKQQQCHVVGNLPEVAQTEGMTVKEDNMRKASLNGHIQETDHLSNRNQDLQKDQVVQDEKLHHKEDPVEGHRDHNPGKNHLNKADQENSHDQENDHNQRKNHNQGNDHLVKLNNRHLALM